MAIVEINLEKPALVEEYQYPGETSERTQSSASRSESSASRSESVSGSKSSGGGKGKLLGLLALVAAVGVLFWKLKSGASGDQTGTEGNEKYEHGPEPEIGGDESGGAKRKVASALGLMVAVATLGAAVRKRRR